jgi:hypothetical protein
MGVNDYACFLDKRGVLRSIASKLAPTNFRRIQALQAVQEASATTALVLINSSISSSA